MTNNVSKLNTEELKGLLDSQSNHFLNGLTNNIAYEDLVAIRMKMKEIANELNKRRNEE